jgi:ubiquinone/menaquinone biosynthesis C-methylase UbiE
VLTDLLHRVVANPTVYDTVQFLAGSAELNGRLEANLGKMPPQPIILDVGGGTGSPPSMLPAGSVYFCLDVDPVKLAGFQRKKRGGTALRGDATHLPFRAQSLDAVICKNVTHHLTDTQVVSLFRESARVLKPDGRMLYIDSVSAPERWRSRLLWRYDRGSHPRTIDMLRQAMGAKFEIVHWEVFVTHHRYVFGVGIPFGSSDGAIDQPRQ